MNSLIARYSRAPRYIWSAAAAAAGALLSAMLGTVLSGWMGVHWLPCIIAAVLFVLSAIVLIVVAAQPAVEISEKSLSIGNWAVPWNEIQQVDYSGWLVPSVVRFTLESGEQKVMLFPGDKETGTNLLRLVRRMSRQALLDGLSYQEFWGDAPKPRMGSAKNTMPAANGLTENNRAIDAAAKTAQAAAAPVRYPMLRPEDEREVEQMFQRLKSVGHLESSHHESSRHESKDDSRDSQK